MDQPQEREQRRGQEAVTVVGKPQQQGVQLCHRVEIRNQDDIIPALHAIYADAHAARAKHNFYAYMIQAGSRVIEHYEDDW